MTAPRRAGRGVYCLSTADWDAPLWTNKQHLMSRLAASGVPVVYVDSLGLRAPGLGGADVRRMASRLAAWRPLPREIISGRLWRDAPLVLPFHRRRDARALNRVLLRARIRRVIARTPLHGPVLWTYTPTAVDVHDQRRFSALVYHCVDDLAAYPGIDAPSFREAEKRLVEAADVCIASSRPLVEHLRRMGAPDPLYWPNPADTGAYSRAARAAPPRAPGRPVTVGFIGAVQEHKVDMDLLCEAARLRPQWRFLMVGPVGIGLRSSGIAERALPDNLQLLGGRPREDLPELVARFDVCMIPYRLNEYTGGVFPMKVFEYLAAGKPVVATSLPSLIGGEVSHVRFADSPMDFVQAIDGALGDDADAAEERMRYADGFSWARRTEQARELLEELWSPRAPAPAGISPA